MSVEAQEKERLTLTLREAADLLGVDARTVSTAVRTGEIPAVRVGRRVLIPARRFHEWLNGKSSTAETATRPEGIGADPVAQLRDQLLAVLLTPRSLGIGADD